MKKCSNRCFALQINGSAPGVSKLFAPSSLPFFIPILLHLFLFLLVKTRGGCCKLTGSGSGSRTPLRWLTGPQVSWGVFKSPSKLPLLIHHAPVWVGRSVFSTSTGSAAGRKTSLLFTSVHYRAKSLISISATGVTDGWQDLSFNRSTSCMNIY